MKYEIHKFSISSSKNLAKTERIIQTDLESRIKTLEQNSDSEKESFLNSIALLNLNSNRFDIRESEITEKDLITALKSMPISKCPGHDGLTKEFYEHFSDDLKLFFINFLKQSKVDGHLSISQR